MRHVAHTEGKLKVGNEVNNGTGGQRHAFFAGKPCSFNTIGGVTRTRRALRSRTKEQGMVEWDNAVYARGASRENRPGCEHRIPKNHSGYKRRTPQNHPGRKRRALPEVEGLLE